jgi:predicted dehydrogenase
VHSVQVALHQPTPQIDAANLPWRVVPAIAGGGLFFDLASHQFDFLDYILGPIASAHGQRANRGGLYAAEDTVSAAFQFESGVVGSGSWCFCAAAGRDEIEIAGERGRIAFSTFGFTPVVLENNSGRREFDIAPPEHVQQPLIQTVVDELLGRGSCPSSGASAARTSQIMDQIIYGA